MQQFKRFVFAIFVIGLLFNFQTVNAQQDSIKTIDESTTPENETKVDSTKKKVSIADKIKSSRKIDGLFTIYQDTVTGSLQMLVKNDQLEKEFIYQSFSMGGPPALFLNQNMLRETWIFKMGKVYDKILFSKVNTNFYFNPEKAISKAANADVSGATFFSSKLIASDSISSLIQVDKLFLGTLLDGIKPNLSPSVKPGSVFTIGRIDPDKSYYTKIRSFPNNTDVVVSLSFNNPNPANGGGKDITDARYVEVKMQHSFLEMPANDFKPRFDDPRVGYFMQQMDDMSTTDPINYMDYINRWYLTKKDPGAEMSEPVEPIIWWVENTTPVEYREVILEAGRKWNEAFEKAGFTNAVVMKQMPDDADWDPADIRYNVIRWVSSDLGFAIGPSFVNPRTGQILGADITIDFGMLIHTLNEEIVSDVAFGAHDFTDGESQLVPIDNHLYCSIANGKKMEYGMARSILEANDAPEEELETLSKQFMTELILHEMGHTMGLSHNMKASHMLSPEELNNKELTRKVGLTGSIMDYTIVNMHSDPSKQGDYYSVKTGPYDWWAIEYGYREFDEASEKEGLTKILNRSTEPQLIFGNDADIVGPGRGIDPRVMVWDQSNDVVAYAKDRFKMVDNAMGKLKTKFVEPGASYQNLFNKFYMIQRNRFAMSNAVSRYIGGIYVDRSFPEQNSENLPFTPVPYAYQKSAMKFLADAVFAPGVFDVDKQLYPYLQRQRRGWNFRTPEDPKIQNYVLGIQAGPLNFIMHPVTLARANTSLLYGNKYSSAEIIQDMVVASFEADMKGNVDIFRQNLQRELANKLINLAENKSRAYDYASSAAAHYELVDLNKQLKKNKSKGDRQTKAHRNSLIYQIDNFLEGE